MRRKTMIGAVLALVLVCLAVLALAAGRLGGGDEKGKSAGPPAAPGEAGMRVTLDPVTGELVRVPGEPDGLDTRDRTGALSTYGGDLVQEPLPQGGFKVDLEGRFQSAVVASIDQVTDQVTVDCVEEHEAGGAEDDHDH